MNASLQYVSEIVKGLNADMGVNFELRHVFHRDACEFIFAENGSLARITKVSSERRLYHSVRSDYMNLGMIDRIHIITDHINDRTLERFVPTLRIC